MPTERLYYDDSYLQAWQATIVAHSEAEQGLRVALDRSAFYPEGGGQPADTGMLNDVAVVDVQVEDGVVWHTLAEPLDAREVQARIDWPRRFDHMQQHHGQHLLSAAFDTLFGFRTVSFHLGSASVTIDLATPALSAEQAYAAEDLANQVIWENRPVTARFVTAQELATLTLRKPPVVDGPIRIVSVPDFDYSACGGTHPSATGGVGIIAIRRWERRGDTTRVEFGCGARAARDLRSKQAIVMRLANAFSVGADELEAAVQRVRSSEDEQRRALADARQQLLAYQAREWVEQAPTIGGAPLVAMTSASHSLDELRLLARTIVELGASAVLGLSAGKGHVLVARGSGATFDAAAVLRDALAQVGGRGGGRPDQAQGGVADPALVQAVVDGIVARIAGQANT